MPLLSCCQCQPMLSCNNQCNLVSMATKVTHTQIARYNVTMYPQRLLLCHTVNVIQCNKHQLAYIATQTMQSRTQNIPFSFLYHPQSQLKVSSIYWLNISMTVPQDWKSQPKKARDPLNWETGNKNVWALGFANYHHNSLTPKRAVQLRAQKFAFHYVTQYILHIDVQIRSKDTSAAQPQGSHMTANNSQGILPSLPSPPHSFSALQRLSWA